MEEEVIESPEEQANHHGHLDDGRDWKFWYVWEMRSKYRIRAGIIEAPPARPQVMPPQQPPKKKQAKSRRKKKESISLG